MKPKLNKDALWRQEIAVKLFSKLIDKTNLVSFFVGGSVARNYADEYSDLEMCFVWEKEISEIERGKLYHYLGFENIDLTSVNNNAEPFEDTLYLKRLQIDIWHLTEDIVQQNIEDVTKSFETNLSKLNLLETFQTCIPIYGDKFIYDIQKKILVYPLKLSKKLIEKYTKDFFKADMDIFIERKDWIFVNRFVTSYLRLVFVALEALNEKYHSGFKRMNKSLEKMELLPNNIDYIYTNLDKLSPKEAWKEVFRIKLETIDLIKAKFSKIDLTYIEHNKENKREKIQKIIS